MDELKRRFIETLQRIHDEADHILGTEGDNLVEVARINAEAIKQDTARMLADLTPR